MNASRVNLSVIGVVVLVAAAFCFGALRPGLRSLEAAQQALAQESVKVREEQTTIGDVGALYASIIDLDQRMKDFRKRLPADRQFGEYLNALAGHIKECGIHEYIIEPRSPRRVDEAALPQELEIVRHATVLPVRIAFDADFPAVMEFLQLMEDLPRISHVESMQMTNQDGHIGLVHVELVLHTYAQAEI